MNFFSIFKYAYKFYNIRKIAMDGDYYSALSKANDFLDDLDDDKKIPVLHLICSIYDVLGDFDNELKYAKETVVLKPSSFKGLYFISNALYNLKEYDDALKYCNSSWESYDGDWHTDWHGEWILIDKGNILFGLGRVDEAKKLFKCLLSSKSNEDVNIWLSKGIFFYKIDDYETAMDCLDKAFNIDPNTFGVYAFKSSILHKLGKFEEAAEFMDVALKIKDSVDET